MMIRILRIVCLIIVATWANFVSAENASKTFNTPEIIRTLFELTTNTSTQVTVFTTPPGRLYQSAGIKILTPGYELVGTTPSSNGYSIFPVSDTQPATFTISGPGTIDISLCLNGTGPRYSCETHRVAVQESLFPTISSISSVSGAVIGESLVPGLAATAGVTTLHFYIFNAPGGVCNPSPIANASGLPATLTNTSILIPSGPPIGLCMAFCNDSILVPYPGQSSICTNAVLIT
jgi:hypothetical protein